MRCPACLRENAASNRFCGACGVRLSAAGVGIGSGAAGDYTPPHLVRDGLVGPTAEGERRPSTVLFCDIVGSTTLATRLGAEHMHATLDHFFRIALGEVHRFDGTVNQFRGDGFMALFGTPRMHEDHARRAVLSALSLRDALRGPGAPRIDGHPLRVRMGLHTGAVVVGRIGDDLRMDFTANGATTHVAARLQETAEPGAIIVSEAVHDAVGRDVVFAPVGRLALRGLAAPTAAFLAVSPAPSSEFRRSGRPRGTVGRTAELERLAATIDAAARGRGSLVAIVGDPGMGKTRLLDEACAEAADRGLRVARATAVAHGRNDAYRPFKEIFAALLDTGDGPTGARDWSALKRRVATLVGDPQPGWLPYLALLLGVRLPDALAARIDALDTLSLRRQVLRAALRALRSVTVAGPVLVALDDWHWCDGSSDGVLEHLGDAVGTLPLAIVVATRPETEGPGARLVSWIEAGNGGTVRPRPLDRVASTQLVEQLLDGAAAPSLVDALDRRAAGNPFYLRELVLALRSSGSITRGADGAGWRLAGDAEELPLSEGVEGVVLARVDRLPDAARGVLKAASVIGRVFGVALLQRVLDLDDPPTDALRLLVEARLVEQRGEGPEADHVFAHPLIQLSVYTNLLAEQRAQLHRRVAAVIESQRQRSADGVHAALAYHYAAAADLGSALRWLEQAGDDAVAVAADSEALDQYRQALRIAEAGPASRVDRDRIAGLQARIGTALFRLGRNDEAADRLARAMALHGARLPSTPAGTAFALALEAVRFVIREAPGRSRPVRAARGNRDRDPVCAILETRGWIDYFRDLRAFALDLLLLSRLAAHHGTEQDRVIGDGGLSMLLDGLGWMGLADRLSDRALQAGRRSGQPIVDGFARMFRAHYLHHAGRLEDGEREAREGAALFLDAGAIRYWALTLGLHALIDRQVGGRAWLESGERLRVVGLETRDAHATLVADPVDGIAAAHRGAHEEAARCLECAVADAAAVPDHVIEVLALGHRAESAAEADRVDEAIAWSTRGLRLARERWVLGTWPTRLRVAAASAELARFEADRRSGTARARAREAIDAALRGARRVHDDGAVDALRLDADLAFAIGDLRRARARWDRAISMAQRLGARRAHALVLHDRGCRTADRADLVAAVEMFEAAGAAGWRARAHAALRALPSG